MAEVNRSQVNRWGRGENRPGYDAARRLALAVYRDHPDLARELVEASGYPWSEPQDLPEPEPAPDLARDEPELYEALFRAYDGDEKKVLAALRAVLETEASERPEGAESPSRRRAG
jgi:hypothetical protein